MIRCDRLIVVRSGQMVLDRLSLTVEPGESLAVIGPSAAGKSTLLAAIATALPLQGGDAVVAGHSIRRDADGARARLGYAPSHLVGWPHLRADEFLRLFANASGKSGRALRIAVDRALEMAGLAGNGATPIDTLSDGQAKMLLLARALLHDPDVLVLDDPFANLDPQQHDAVERLVHDAQLAGRTIVATIDDARVPDCFTHLGVLCSGRLVLHGPADFSALSAGRSWRYRIRCPGASASAAAAVEGLAHNVAVIDTDAIDVSIDAGAGGRQPTIAEAVRELVDAGIRIEAVGFHPAWTAQLLEHVGRE